MKLQLRRAAFCAAIVAGLISSPTAAPSPNIVISQIYGGGGNSGATYTNDFIEIFNRGAQPIAVDGWSVQYASSAGTSWQRTNLSGTIPAGGYYLVQQASGAGGTVSLPAPDAVGTIAMSASSAKVALVSNTATLSGSCPSSVVDLVGFGSANCSETTPAPVLSNTTAAIRSDGGCSDTDNNAVDFSAAAPAPRNSASPVQTCSGPPALSIDDVTTSEGNSGTTTATFTVSLSAPSPVAVTFDIATADQSATVADGDYAPSSLAGQVIEAGTQTYSFAVTINGDVTVEANESFLVNITPVAGAIAGDTQGLGTILNDDQPPVVHDVVISQVYGGGGNSGATYTHDFVELFNRGTSAVSLAGWSIQYTSVNGSTWQVTSLSGSIAPGGYFLIRQAAGSGGTTPLPTPDAAGSIFMSATAGKVALRASGAALAGACPAGLDIVDLVGFGVTSCHEGAGPTAATSNSTAALRKRGGCVDTNHNAADFSIGEPAPRNSSTAPRSCGYTAATIPEIQGAGLATPFLGQDVNTSGVVTAVKNNGFFMQSPAADASPETSEGIFVFTSTAPALNVGDLAAVRGTPVEFFSLTQLDSTLDGDVTIISSGNPLPEPIVLTTDILTPTGGLAQLERFEGMRMRADTLVSVAPTNNFGEIEAVLPSVPRPMREPGIEITAPVPPDPTTGVADCCIPRWDMNPERILVDSDWRAGSAATAVTSNVTLSNVVGPLDYSFSRYKVLPESSFAVTPNMAAVPVPAPAPGEFTVAGFNIENFRHSNTTQLRKASLAIRTVLRYPDVIGHVEILDLESLQTLATQVNDDAVAAGEPNPMYEARLIPAATGTQHVGFLVKTSRVGIVSVTQERATETYIDPTTGLPATLHDRPPLVLHATFGPTARPLIVVANHLRSYIDAELVGGEGPRVRAKRTAQAESLAGLLQELQLANPGTPVISVGDYNAYQFNDGYTDPIAVIKGEPTPDDEVVVDASPDLVDPNFVNLTDELPAAERYSFIFEGTPQALDHVIVNAVARSYLTRYVVARNNADFPESPAALFAGDESRPERNSDHDMPVAYFDFTAPSILGLTVTPDSLGPPNHKMIDVSVGYTASDDSGAVACTLSVASNEATNSLGDGNTAFDWQVLGPNHVLLRAERSGTGSGRVYTVTVTCTDTLGNVSSASRTASVTK